VTIRWRDKDRVLGLSVRDLVEGATPSGHLSLEVVRVGMARLAEGRDVHQRWQAEQAARDPEYRAEVTVRRQLVVSGWTVNLQGRVDGLVDEDGHTVVEEVKSSALDAHHLDQTSVDDWSNHAMQLRLYLWMLAEEGFAQPVGRLVLVSLADGTHRVFGVGRSDLDVGAWAIARLERLIAERERRLAWLTIRRGALVPDPFDAWRPGQEAILHAIRGSTAEQRPLLVQAPTGLGKTAAALTAALRRAMAFDQQVYWATARTTHQQVAEEALRLMRARGLAVRSVTLSARDKVCLNTAVSCRPEACPFAEGYYDKLAATRIVDEALAAEALTRDALMALGRTHEVCPYQLAQDVAGEVDVVIGDYNYVFDPDVRLKRFFAEEVAASWVVVVDEAHQLVDRARGYGSPAMERSVSQAAVAWLEHVGADGFAALARELDYRVLEAGEAPLHPPRHGEAPVALRVPDWQEIAARVDEVGMDYALLKARSPALGEGPRDPWLDLARATLRFARIAATAGEETVTLAGYQRGREHVRLACLDPSPWLGPFIASLGGFIGLSATLSPSDFYRDLLGLTDGGWDRVEVDDPFPPERRRVIVAPRISTLFRDRAAHAPATATLIDQLAAATPGNVAVYFPSFAMLEDLAPRLILSDRVVLRQRADLNDAERAGLLEALRPGNPPAALLAVLGGSLAEGVDLPPGALDTIVVIGPGLPTVSLELDLRRARYEERYQQGFRYASLVPGLTRVVQAAGRLIRRPEDRGVIVLVGARFRWRDIRALLPAAWDATVADDPAQFVQEFFAAADT